MCHPWIDKNIINIPNYLKNRIEDFRFAWCQTTINGLESVRESHITGKKMLVCRIRKKERILLGFRLGYSFCTKPASFLYSYKHEVTSSYRSWLLAHTLMHHTPDCTLKCLEIHPDGRHAIPVIIINNVFHVLYKRGYSNSIRRLSRTIFFLRIFYTHTGNFQLISHFA